MLRAARITLEGVGLFTIFASIVGFVAFFELANLLQYENRPEKADFIFPLAGDAQRLTKAAQLYNEGFASRILLSNEINQRPLTVATFSETQSDASALHLNTLAAAGVSPDDIMQFGENLASTAEEAEALRARPLRRDELQRLEICSSLRSPIQVLARSASAWLAAAVLPRVLYNSASPKYDQPLAGARASARWNCCSASS